MSRHLTEAELALYAGDDLSPGEARQAAEHLRQCIACEQTLAGLRDGVSRLRLLLQDPGAADLALLRDGVLRRLSARRRPIYLWPAVAAIAAGLLMVAIVLNRPASLPVIENESQELLLEDCPARPWRLEVAVVKPPVRRVAPGIQSVALLTRADRPSTIKMTTTDPNVVILWQTERTE